MGYILIEGAALARPALQARPIGGVPRVHRVSFSVTTIRPASRSATPIFDAELPVEVMDTTCTFHRRRSDRLIDENYRRTEFVVTLEKGRDHEITADSRLFLAEMPLGQRRVHRANFQKYCRTREPVVFEDIEGLEPPFETHEKRSAASANDAQKALQSCRVNYFSSEPALTASLSDTELTSVSSFEDSHDDHPRRRRDSSFAVAVVNNPEQIRDEILRDKTLLKTFDMTGNGKLNTPNNKSHSWVRLPPEVSSLATQHLDIAVLQSMCGAGLRCDQWLGRPVADYARYLFQEHMLRALRRRDGEFFDAEGHRVIPREELPDPSWDFPNGT